MFARILDFEIKLEKKEEFVKIVQAEILPILKKQLGFLEILPFIPEKLQEEKIVTVSLWATKMDAEKYEMQFYPEVLNILKPFLLTPINVKPYVLETKLCERFVETFAA